MGSQKYSGFSWIILFKTILLTKGMPLYEADTLGSALLKYVVVGAIAFGVGYYKGFNKGRDGINEKINSALERLIDIEDQKVQYKIINGGNQDE